MANHFYDGQVKRYITQVMRLMSNFYWKNGSGDIKQIPVMYGDMTRQVASIIKENSENKLISVPRMSVYVTGLDIDRSRTSDSSFVSKVNIRERSFDVDGNEYLNTQGKNYTVERLMPTPYIMTLNVDIWSSNTDQKLQILEQILMLFNPSLEIQTSDNYIDWTSLSVVNLERVEFSNRTIPAGAESEIDVATLNFNTPIYISPPAKVKRLGVVTNIITSILSDVSSDLNLDLGGIGEPILREKSSFVDGDGNKAHTVDKGAFPNIGDGQVDVNTNRSIDTVQGGATRFSTTYQDYGAVVINDTAMLVNDYEIGTVSWKSLMDVHPGTYQAGISQIRLRTAEQGLYVIGSIAINSADETKLDITWDTDTIPSNTALTSFDGNERTTIDFIIDPLRWNPQERLVAGLRLLLLDNIGNVENTSGAPAWKNINNTDFIADEGDIIEWSGSAWSIIFDASSATDPIYTRNLNTGIQYKWTPDGWIKSFEGEYSGGTWMLYLDG
jgi:hypothetical protein